MTSARSGDTSQNPTFLEDVEVNYQLTTRDTRLEQIRRNSLPGVRALFRRKGLKGADIDDLAQEVILKFARYSDYIEPHNLHSYIMHIAATIAVDHSRRKSYHEKTGILGHTEGDDRDILERDTLSPLFDNTPPGPETAALNRARSEQLYQALRQLPERDRTILTLHYLQEYPYAAIGKALQMSEKAVNMAAIRACRKLKDILGSEDAL
jgi:RNA polymerase sigma factor (sigma-70 family)